MSHPRTSGTPTAGPAPTGPAAARWAEALAARAIPADILAAAPADPYGHETRRFLPPPEPADTPSRRRGLELLGDGGHVLDVGCGAGAAALALAPSVTHVTGVDDATDMLAAFAQACLEWAVPYDAVLGRWPGAAVAAGPADVVVCRHVVYDAPDLDAFVAALDAAAARGVVLEMTSEHPMAWLDPLWARFHDVHRPAPPTAEDALAVITELGLEPTVERWPAGTSRAERATTEDLVLRTCRRLCLPASRAEEVAAALAGAGTPPTEKVTVSWPTRGTWPDGRSTEGR